MHESGVNTPLSGRCIILSVKFDDVNLLEELSFITGDVMEILCALPLGPQCFLWGVCTIWFGLGVVVFEYLFKHFRWDGLPIPQQYLFETGAIAELKAMVISTWGEDLAPIYYEQLQAIEAKRLLLRAMFVFAWVCSAACTAVLIAIFSRDRLRLWATLFAAAFFCGTALCGSYLVPHGWEPVIGIGWKDYLLRNPPSACLLLIIPFIILVFYKWAHHEATNRRQSPNAAAIFMQLGGRHAERPLGPVYYPNRFKKRSCRGTSCHGIAARCPIHSGICNPRGVNQCWRVSFRTQLKLAHEAQGVLLQIVEAGGLGPGQLEEQAWALEEGIECWHIHGNDIASMQRGLFQGALSHTDG
eukprot:TRINITY_DN75043_c0_g1_i1.p1 TRINITY_DN75043_c0_g1~~TRINITY_DN75043_c0_g1_i1.p1  ORF type:complete len:380 (-),score=18.77 TRINITY_DN75043_c0_g1_i1:230-1300(-)